MKVIVKRLKGETWFEIAHFECIGDAYIYAAVDAARLKQPHAIFTGKERRYYFDGTTTLEEIQRMLEGSNDRYSMFRRSG